MDVSSIVLLAVFVDHLGVALVIPNLSFYMKDLGLTRSGLLLGLVTSAYSLAQVLGGVVLGYLSDSYITRRDMLLLSFIGAGLSYAMVGMALLLKSPWLFIISRVTVGLVKQTMVSSTALILEALGDQSDFSRTTYIGRLQGMVSLAFTVGPFLGGLLSTFGTACPPFVATGLFLLDAIFVSIFLPRKHTSVSKNNTIDTKETNKMTMRSTLIISKSMQKNDVDSTRIRDSAAESQGRKRINGPSLIALLLSAVRDGNLVLFLAYRGVSQAMFSLGTTYQQDRFDVSPQHYGAYRSFNRIVAVTSQWFIVPFATHSLGFKGALIAALVSVVLVNTLIACEDTTWLTFVITQIPAFVGHQLVRTCLKSASVRGAQKGSLGSMLALQDVLLSIMGVLGPFYGGFLLDFVGSLRMPLMSAVHYALITILALVVLHRGSGALTKEKES